MLKLLGNTKADLSPELTEAKSAAYSSSERVDILYRALQKYISTLQACQASWTEALVAFQQSDGDGFGISNTDLIGALPRLFNADPLLAKFNENGSSRILNLRNEFDNVKAHIRRCESLASTHLHYVEKLAGLETARSKRIDKGKQEIPKEAEQIIRNRSKCEVSRVELSGGCAEVSAAIVAIQDLKANVLKEAMQATLELQNGFALRMVSGYSGSLWSEQPAFRSQPEPATICVPLVVNNVCGTILPPAEKTISPGETSLLASMSLREFNGLPSSSNATHFRDPEYTKMDHFAPLHSSDARNMIASVPSGSEAVTSTTNVTASRTESPVPPVDPSFYSTYLSPSLFSAMNPSAARRFP